MNKKKYLKIIIIFFYIITFFSIWNTFWDDACNKLFESMKIWNSWSSKAPICTSSPDFIDKYFSDNINILNSISWKTNSSSWLTALWAKTLQTTLWTVWITLMFWSLWIWNFFQNFYILKEDPNVVRDWTKIINFKQYITKKTLLASRKSILTENIDEKIINQIKSSNNFVFGTYKLHTYKDLFSYLWKNQIAFEQIYYDKIVLLDKKDEIINQTILYNTGEEINLIHLNTIISKINNNYFKWNQKIECNNPFNDFIDAIKNITCNLWWDKLSKASKRFSCNYNRLLNALNLWWSEWNCWNVKLKKGLSLTDRLKVNASIEWVWKIMSNNSFTTGWKELWNNIKKWFNSVLDWMKKIKNTILHPINKYNTITWDNTIINNTYFNNQIEYIQSQIETDYNETTKKLTSIEPWLVTNDTTKLFPEISQNIYKIINKIDDNIVWIYELTAKACENQSPSAWDCRY